jgi:carboxylesterase
VAIGDPFELVGDLPLGVVCVHGFSGTPYEVRYLGERLHAAGHSVVGLRLPGHGTSVDDLDRSRWGEWVDAVEHAVDALSRTCDRVAVVGQSLGGLLALYVASRQRRIAGVATLAAPLWLDGLAGKVAAWAARIAEPRIRKIPKLYGSDVRDAKTRAENPCYPAIPVRALGELARFMRVATDALPAITQPVLVLHARRDHTAPVACAARIAELARARRVRILDRSYHLIAADVERDIVAAEVIDFLRRQVTGGALACGT